MKAVKKYVFTPDYAVPPGETLKEVMDSLDMSQRELAVRTGLTVQSLNRMFKGEQPITYMTANRLELATGVPAHMWNNLEAYYREQLAKIEERKRLEADLDWLKTIPTKILIQHGEIEEHKGKALLLRDTLKFYGVSSVAAWHDIWEKPAVAARRSSCFESKPGAASTWIRLGEIQAHAIDCQPFDQTLFKQTLKDIRKLTVQEPEVFVPEMQTICAKAGVALVLVPEIKGVPWNGATKWLTASKAMILLNLRGKSEDLFWFSFFHEAGHVINDSKKDLYINDGSKGDPREQKADEFAAESLITRKFDNIIKNVSKKSEIKNLATSLGISPGIVAGRFQHLTKKWAYFKDLQCKLEWA